MSYAHAMRPRHCRLRKKKRSFGIRSSRSNEVRLWHTPKMSLANIEKLDSGAAKRRRRYLNSPSQDNNISFHLHPPCRSASLLLARNTIFFAYTSGSTFGFTYFCALSCVVRWASTRALPTNMCRYCRCRFFDLHTCGDL